jgi:fluoride exporter
MTLLHIFMVGIGGFFGAIARYSISKQLNNKSTFEVPVGTLTVNLLGAFLLGLITGSKADTMILLLFGTGFIGAFTTFSTLKLEMTQLYMNKHKKTFILYTLITYGFGIILAYLGYLVGGYLFSMNGA